MCSTNRILESATSETCITSSGERPQNLAGERLQNVSTQRVAKPNSGTSLQRTTSLCGVADPKSVAESQN